MLKIIKVLFISFCIMQICPSFAVDACVEDDTVAIVLDPSASWNAASLSEANCTWGVSLGNTTIKGICARLSGDTANHPFGYTETQLIDNGTIVIGNERNVDSDGKSACWCKITYPVVSAWSYTYYYTDVPNACAWICRHYMSDSAASNIQWRRKLFNTIN